MKRKIPILQSVLLMVIWGAITMFGAIVMTGGEDVPLDELISHQLAYPIISAALISVLYIFFLKIDKQVGISFDINYKSWVLIYPIAVIFVLLVTITIYGEGASGIMGWIIINTFFVGISEELMFRGVLLSSFAQKFSFWKSALIVSLLFGLIHVTNGFITGDFVNASLQAVMATLSGFLFLGIRLKTNSILPAIILHWLWDFSVFMVSTHISEEIQSEPIVLAALVLAGLSPFVFGITGIVQCFKKEVTSAYMSTQRINL